MGLPTGMGLRDQKGVSAVAMIARCMLRQNSEIPVPVVSPTLIEAIPEGFNREGVLPEAWGSAPDAVLSEGVEGV